MIQVVNAAQSRLEAASWERVRSVNASAPAPSAAALSALAADEARKVLATWWALPDELIFKFSDGWADDQTTPRGYSDAWLKEAGWEQGPPPPPKDPKLPHCCQDSFKGGKAIAVEEQRRAVL